jgi:ribokinase
MAIAHTVLASGVETVLVTLGADGCLVARRDASFHVRAPVVEVVDGCGAGATFSAGVIYGHLQGWELETVTRFAIAAASLKCTVVGPQAFPLSVVHQRASDLTIERAPMAAE